MGRLPTIQDMGPRPEPQPGTAAPGYRTPEGGELQGLEVMNIGKQVAHFAQVEQEKADTTRVEDAWNKYKNAALDVTAGENGVLRTQGGDAVNGDILKKAQSKLQTVREGLLADMPPEVAQRFTARADATDYQVRQQTVEHLVQQGKVYADVVQNARIATAATAIGAMPTDGNLFNSTLSDLAGKSRAWLKSSKGIDESTPEGKMAVDKYLSDVKDALIDKRLSTLAYDKPELLDAQFRNLADEIHNPDLKRDWQRKVMEVSGAVITRKDATRFVADTYAKMNPVQGLVEVKSGTAASELKAINDKLSKWTEKDIAADPSRYQELISVKDALETGLKKASFSGAVETEVFAPNTSGKPTSKDIRAQLPIALAMVEKGAKERGYIPGTIEYENYRLRTENEIRRIVTLDGDTADRISKQNYESFQDALLGPVLGTGKTGAQGTGNTLKVTSAAQVMASSVLAPMWQEMTSEQKMAALRTMKAWNNEDGGGNPDLTNEFRNRLYLPPGDPNKINSWTQIMNDPRVVANGLNNAQLTMLRAHYGYAQTEEGVSHANQIKGGEAFVRNYYDNKNGKAMQIMGTSAIAQYEWAKNAYKVVGEYNRENKPIDELFDRNNPKSLVSQSALDRWEAVAGGASSADALKFQADKVRAAAAQPVIESPATIKTPQQAAEWVKTLPPGTRFRGPGDPPGSFRTTSGSYTETPKTAVKGTSDVAPPTLADTQPGARQPPPGTISLDPATGKIIETPAAVAPTAAPPSLVPPPVEDSPMPKRIKPGSVADRTAKSGATLEARRWENDARAYARQQGLASDIGDAMMVPVRVYQAPGKAAEWAGREIAQMIPIESARVLAAYRDIGKRGYSEYDADVIQRALQLGSPFLSPKEIQNGKDMLKDLGVDELAPGGSGSGGGGGMTKAEADAAAKSGIFDKVDKANRAARGADKPAEPASYKAGTDDVRNTGKSTKEQDDAFIAMYMRHGESKASAMAELKRIKAKGR